MADDLMSMFTSMGTTDHNELIQQFMQVVPGAPAEAAQFFLEANSMNLQAAIMCYMDQGGTGAVSQALAPTPEAQFVCDVTIGEGEEVSPDTKFQKTWRLRNTGQTAWPPHTILTFLQGEQLNGPNHIRVPELHPGKEIDLSVHLKSPNAVGIYAGSWRLCWVSNGVPNYFGEEIWVVITVSASGMLGALQQMHGTSIDEQGLQVNPLRSMGGNHPSPMTTGDQPSQQPQRETGNLFAVPQFGSLASHTFGAGIPNTGFGQTNQEQGFQSQQGNQQGDGMES